MAPTINPDSSQVTALTKNSSAQKLSAKLTQDAGLSSHTASTNDVQLNTAIHQTGEVQAINLSMRNANEGVFVAKAIGNSLQQVGDKLQQMKQLAETLGNNSSIKQPPLNTELAVTSSEADVEATDISLTAMAQINGMLDQISTAQTQINSTQGAFQSSVNASQDQLKARSSNGAQIIDADFADAAAKRVSTLIRQQGGDAIAVQANLFPKSVLQLIV